MRLRKRERLDTTLRFQVTESLKERLWRLCEERGVLPSHFLRQAMLNEMERLERLENNNKQESQTEKGG